MNTIFLLITLFLVARPSYSDIPKECGPDKECLIEVPGSQCADGTPSFITLTQRAGAKKLLIYLSGGGACWSKQSCERGLAKPLTRTEEPTEWTIGEGIHGKKASKNPYGQDYNVITVPYCTGDVYAGDRIANYGTDQAPYLIRHLGYVNMLAQLKRIKTQVPSPEKVVMLGCSAGGIGVYYHLRNLAATYPDVPKYVVSDAGTPFRPPQVNADNYEKIMDAWGARATMPQDETFDGSPDFGKLIDYNNRHFPEIKFGLISSYSDRVMKFFAIAIGAASPGSVVRDTIIGVATDFMEKAANDRVFFIESSVHCHTSLNLVDTQSLGTSLGDWLTSMGNDGAEWKDVRPDKGQVGE